ncbi:MAG: hypothetical protein J6N74_03915 [Chryseobacterium sp.]|nr:hypothetical protein [Chryseobacterium sp.]
MKTLLIITGTLCLGFSCSEKVDYNKIFIENQNREHAISELKTALENRRIIPESEIDYDTKSIPDSKSAIIVAEKILFKVYGKEEIKKQRPYNVVFQSNYWIINGTMSKTEIGGVFLIILNSKDGKILELIHGE